MTDACLQFPMGTAGVPITHVFSSVGVGALHSHGGEEGFGVVMARFDIKRVFGSLGHMMVYQMFMQMMADPRMPSAVIKQYLRCCLRQAMYISMGDSETLMRFTWGVRQGIVSMAEFCGGGGVLRAS